jgi:hypothetical protein
MEARQLWNSNIISIDAYAQQVQRGKIDVLQRGCRNRPALIYYDTLPVSIRLRVDGCMYGSDNTAETGGVASNVKPAYEGFFKSMIKADKEALRFFSEYQISEGISLKPEVIKEYYTNAMILNAMRDTLIARKNIRNACGVRGNKKADLFKSVVREVAALDKREFSHSLPKSEKRLREAYKTYFGGLETGENTAKSYAGLIHKNYNNQSARKVTADTERLILSLYCRSNNPYAEWTHADYIKFIKGEITVFDYETGEAFNPAGYCNSKGEPIELSEATVRNYLNNPENRAITNSIRMGYYKFGALKRPHYHRQAPQYSLSKISLDDRDLPRLTYDGRRVKAYYAYDVMSGALIGKAYSMKKDTNLFLDCMRDMFRTLAQNGLGVPMELEVENHLVRNFQDDLMKAGNVFPFVRWCAPTNSQEKHAEHFNREKKYGYEKRYQDGIGRVRGNRLEANQTDNKERYYDENVNEYRYREKRYTFEELVADDFQTVEAYNGDSRGNNHVSRWNTLLQNANPDVAPLKEATWLRYIGYEVKTSIRRNQYVQVQNAYYQLASADILRRLQPNIYNVTAYYLPAIDGAIGEVYLYQGDVFLCCANKIEKFADAQAEWTDKDSERMTAQAKYISHFDKTVREGSARLARVGTISDNMQEYGNMSVEILPDVVRDEQEGLEYEYVLLDDYKKRAFDNA